MSHNPHNLDAVTLTSQSISRPLSGIGTDLFDLGCQVMHSQRPSICADIQPDNRMLREYDRRDGTGGNGG
mgnify:CR=1 FL=1